MARIYRVNVQIDYIDVPDEVAQDSETIQNFLDETDYHDWNEGWDNLTYHSVRPEVKVFGDEV